VSKRSRSLRKGIDRGVNDLRLKGVVKKIGRAGRKKGSLIRFLKEGRKLKKRISLLEEKKKNKEVFKRLRKGGGFSSLGRGTATKFQKRVTKGPREVLCRKEKGTRETGGKGELIRAGTSYSARKKWERTNTAK